MQTLANRNRNHAVAKTLDDGGEECDAGVVGPA